MISGIILSTKSLGSISTDPSGVNVASVPDNDATVAAIWDDMDTIEENLCPKLAILAFLEALERVYIACRGKSGMWIKSSLFTKG